jgi:hypothetical protein
MNKNKVKRVALVFFLRFLVRGADYIVTVYEPIKNYLK